LSAGEIILILVIALLVFGPARLPELGRTLSKWLYEIRKGMHDLTSDTQSEIYKIDKHPNNTGNLPPEEEKTKENET